MYLNIKSLIICSALAVMCASACRNKGQEGEVVVSETMTEEVSAESGAVTVAVTETDALKMYKPVRDGGIWLHREPTRDSGRVFIAAAAITPPSVPPAVTSRFPDVSFSSVILLFITWMHISERGSTFISLIDS